MKKYSIYMMTALITAIFITGNVNSQTSGIPYLNKQLRTLFGTLNLPPNPKLFLYDMAVHVSDTDFFRTKCPDTLESAMWYKLYEEMYNSAYDTSLFEDPDSLYVRGNGFYSDTIPMGIFNYAFYKLKPGALTSNLYFDFDTINNRFIDKYPRPGYPYLDSNIFASAPMVEQSFFSNPVFRIDPAFFMVDIHNSAKYENQVTLKIDFGDGNGFVTFNPSVLSHHQVNYLSSGYKYIKTAVINNNNLKIMHSSLAIFNVINSTSMTPPNSTINVPGLQVGVYSGCSGNGLTSGKLVVYLAGFDMLEMLPSASREIPRIYAEMISSNRIAELKNMDYSFVVVKYIRSTIDIRFNALYVVNLLEKLKCGLDMSNQFVVMGESMGGLVGRFALTYMESPEYDNQDLSPFFVDENDINNVTYLNYHPEIYNLPDQWCLTDKHHNTRQFITIDCPHQGANVPLSIQHVYRGAMIVLSKMYSLNLKYYATVMNLFLDAQAAQQMLIYHIDTKSGTSYSSHGDKTEFFNQLQAMGDYPVYAKTTALSNGSLQGENQTNYITGGDRLAGDRILDLDMDIYGVVLGRKINVMDINFECNTNPNGYGKLLGANITTYAIFLKLFKWGIDFQIGYVPIVNINIYGNVLPYCTSAGGYTGYPVWSNGYPKNGGYNISNTWILNVFHYDYSIRNNGCMEFDSHLGFNGFLSANLDFTMCTDGLHFTLVPVQSALDYGTLGSIPLSHDIENENITSKLNKVKPDVIIGYPDGGNFINRNHTGNGKFPFRNVEIYNITQTPGPNDDYTYYSCINYNDSVKRGVINLEIGDEELYLENAELNWTSMYEVEYDIHVNERNPYFEYAGFPKTVFAIDGFYSKADPFSIGTTGIASFLVDENNSPTTIGLSYSAPHTGTYNKITQAMPICCINYVGSRLAQSPATLHEDSPESFLKLFPNPNNGSQVVLTYRFKEKGNVLFQLLNSLGHIVLEERLKSPDATSETTTALSLNGYLKTGMYVVRLINDREVITERLIIQQN